MGMTVNNVKIFKIITNYYFDSSNSKDPFNRKMVEMYFRSIRKLHELGRHIKQNSKPVKWILCLYYRL